MMSINLSGNCYLRTITLIVLLIANSFLADNSLSDSQIPENKTKSGEQIEEDKMVMLEKDMGLIELIRILSKINNETYVLEESVKTKEVTIITPEGGIKEEDFIKFLDTILDMNGISIVKTGGINKVISSSRIMEEKTPTIIE